MNNLAQSVAAPASRLLIHDKPIMVLPSLAIRIGDRHAYILQQVHYWLTLFQESGNERKFINGRWWVYNTAEEWQKTNFPWLHKNTVKRILQDLEKMGLLISSRLEASKSLNQRKWYSVEYEAIAAIESFSIEVSSTSAAALVKAVREHVEQRKIPSTQNESIERPKMNQSSESKRVVDLYTETNSTETSNPENSSDIDKHKPKSDFLAGACFLEEGRGSHDAGKDGNTPLLDGLSALGSAQKEKSSAQKEKGAAPVFMPWRIGDDYESELFCGQRCIILPGTTRAQRPLAKTDFAIVKQAGAIALKEAKRFLLELGTSLVEVDEESDDEGFTYCQREHADFEVEMSRAVQKDRVATMQHLLELALSEGLTTAPEFNGVLHKSFVDAIAWLKAKDEKKKTRRRATPVDASQPF